MFDQLPLQFPVALHCASGKLPGVAFMFGFRFGGFFGFLEGGDDAMAHFTCSFPRKGDGDDRLGMVHCGKQREEALDQEFRFAGTRGSLHDERARGVQRAQPLGLIRDRFRNSLRHRYLQIRLRRLHERSR